MKRRSTTSLPRVARQHRPRSGARFSAKRRRISRPPSGQTSYHVESPTDAPETVPSGRHPQTFVFLRIRSPSVEWQGSTECWVGGMNRTLGCQLWRDLLRTHHVWSKGADLTAALDWASGWRGPSCVYILTVCACGSLRSIHRRKLIGGREVDRLALCGLMIAYLNAFCLFFG